MGYGEEGKVRVRSERRMTEKKKDEASSRHSEAAEDFTTRFSLFGRAKSFAPVRCSGFQLRMPPEAGFWVPCRVLDTYSPRPHVFYGKRNSLDSSTGTSGIVPDLRSLLHAPRHFHFREISSAWSVLFRLL
ncbi:hypothetical protein PAPYR_5510 [Paratrimastix pyriformis]|uniref:Uncharacterized protein n=1 Tax=Paratrimastix pyriformis TaxID=342808 RepID=A0ABQ8UHM4_9EUKA|nr:hypothetical protein PAPYR_5510 [Paratrimastix pyriformis]